MDISKNWKTSLSPRTSQWYSSI